MSLINDLKKKKAMAEAVQTPIAPIPAPAPVAAPAPVVAAPVVEPEAPVAQETTKTTANAAVPWYS